MLWVSPLPVSQPSDSWDRLKQTIPCLGFLGLFVSLNPILSWLKTCTGSTLERFRITITANAKREFVPGDQVFPFLIVDCIISLNKISSFFTQVSWTRIILNSFISSAHFLFWQIWRSPFVVNVILNLSIVFKTREYDMMKPWVFLTWLTDFLLVA